MSSEECRRSATSQPLSPPSPYLPINSTSPFVAHHRLRCLAYSPPYPVTPRLQLVVHSATNRHPWHPRSNNTFCCLPSASLSSLLLL